MTDYDKLKKCFDEIGIKYDTFEQVKIVSIVSTFDDAYIQIVFDKSGKYIEMQ